jgi:hypothetical protein
MRIFKDMYSSITNISFYKQVVNFEKKRVLKYFLMLAFLSGLVLAVGKSPGIVENVFNAFKISLGGEIPEIVIEKGIVSSNVKQPYKVNIGTPQKEFAFIIDTTGQVTDLGMEYSGGILLTKDSMIIKQGINKKKVIDISNEEYFVFNEQTLLAKKKLITWLGLPLFIMLFFSLGIMMGLFQVLFMSSMGVLISKISKIDINYRKLVKISVYALTPAAVILVVLTMISMFKLAQILSLIAFVVFFVLGLFENNMRR